VLQCLAAPAFNAVFSAGARRILLPNSAASAADSGQRAQSLVRQALEDSGPALRVEAFDPIVFSRNARRRQSSRPPPQNGQMSRHTACHFLIRVIRLIRGSPCSFPSSINRRRLNRIYFGVIISPPSGRIMDNPSSRKAVVLRTIRIISHKTDKNTAWVVERFLVKLMSF
jgi:hypothetical protein